MNELLKIIADKILIFEFVFVFLFIGIGSLILSVYIKKETFRVVFLVFFSLFLSLGAIEYVLSFKYDCHPAWPFKIRHILDVNKIIVYPINNNKSVSAEKKQNSLFYSEYDNKFRYTQSNRYSKFSYVFLGCSFTFGDFLNDDNTLPYYFSELMNFQSNVINCGVQGHGLNTANNILKNDLIYDLCPGRNIDYFFYSLIDEHNVRNFRILDPSDNKVYSSGTYVGVKQPFGIFKIIFARSYIFRKVFLPLIDKYNEEFYADYSIKAFKEMEQIIKEKYKSKLTIIIWPCVKKELIVKLMDEKFDIVLLPRYFNSREYGYRLDDLHPSAKANEEIAQILYNHTVRTSTATAKN